MKQYIKQNVTKNWLIKNDFRFNRYYSTKEDSIYTYRFSVGVGLECELFMYYPEGITLINIYNEGTRDKYPAFYNNKYGKWNKILNKINNKIDNKLHQLNIINMEESNYDKRKSRTK